MNNTLRGFVGALNKSKSFISSSISLPLFLNIWNSSLHNRILKLCASLIKYSKIKKIQPRFKLKENHKSQVDLRFVSVYKALLHNSSLVILKSEFK